MTTERAFLSMADKSELPKFAEKLAGFYTLLSYGGTKRAIEGAGVELGNLRDTLSLTLNLPREELASEVARQLRKREIAKPIGLVCVGIKPIPANFSMADLDKGGPLIIVAALDAGKPVISRNDQFTEAIERLEAGEFHDPTYQSQLADDAWEQVTTYIDLTDEKTAQWAPAKT